MLQKDSLFRRNESFFRSPTPVPPASPAAAAETPRPVEAAKQPVVDKHDERKESKLIVGPDIKMKGVEIADCDTLVVEGRVEASMDSRVIQIAESGVFVGRVGIDVAEIRGHFEGELTAHRQLVIHASGRVSGTIRYGTISIEEGGELSGDVAAIASTKAIATGASTDPNRKAAPNAAATPAPHALTGDGRNAGGDKFISALR